MSAIHKGMKYRLRPTTEQEGVLRQHGGNARFLWNQMRTRPHTRGLAMMGSSSTQ